MPAQSTSSAPGSSAQFDTFPKLLIENARRLPDRPAMREKDLGIWQTWSWSQMFNEIRDLTCGLFELGVQPGDKVAIIGDNRPSLYWTMTAAQTLGAVPVPLYQDAVAQEMIFILDNADVRCCVVEDQEQVDKLLEIKGQCPKVEHIIYVDPRGLRDYEQPYLHCFEQIQARGQEFRASNPDFFDVRAKRQSGDDVAIMLYTSGTTGSPKGVVMTFNNLIVTGRNGAESEGLGPSDEVLAYLPMAWVGDNLFSFTQQYVAGFCVNCPESSETVMHDMREIGPSYYFAPPRVYENLLTQVMIRMEDASAPKRAMFRYFMDVAKRVGTAILDGKPVSSKDRWLYRLGNILLYAPLKNTLGFSRIRVAYTAGEAIGPEIFEFYRSLGINVKQLYGQTEAAVLICSQPNGQVRADTVGPPCKGVEVKISESGEVIYRGPGVFHSYYKNEKSTAETKTEDGWVLTGDAGYFDEEGHLRIIDRAKDVGKLSDGSMFAPKYLENKLKFFPYVKEAVAFGSGRDFVTAFINLDLEAVGSWAERKGLGYTGYTDLAGQKPVYDLLQECVEKTNLDLSKDPKLASSQIRRFLILPKELDPDDGELTRTRKVRRKFIAERYGELIEGMFEGRSSVHVDMEVKFEDGRAGRLKADVEIRDAGTHGPQETRKAS